MRRNLLLGNWKQNTTRDTAIELLDALKTELEKSPTKTELGVIPPALFIDLAIDKKYNACFFVGMQNISKTEKGAFTGEIGADMAASVGVKYALVGHSERRAYFNESDSDLTDKLNQCLANNIVPVFCIGEQLSERKSGEYSTVLEAQIKAVVFGLSAKDLNNIVVAYEPVWAIGTGETASAEQAQEVHAFIRDLLVKQFGEVGSNISILYGGSCKSSNAVELFSQPDIDGGLIGGASLNAQDFIAIANSF